MFLDGDAFPVADPIPLIEAGLKEACLLAVRRAEVGSPLPHPCFCVTRVGTWRSLPGDWGRGFVTGMLNEIPLSDVGANLLRQLQLSEVPWAEVLRSNRCNPHQLLFGVYGSAIYHHGAGFRRPITASDLRAFPDMEETARMRSSQVSEAVAHNARLSAEIFECIQRDEDDWLTQLI